MIKELLSFYFYFITLYVLDLFKQRSLEKELSNTLSIVYRDEVRNKLLDQILQKYNEEKVDLEKFIMTEFDSLNHVNIRFKLNEIHLQTD
jgi:hypothetical protein